MRKIEVLFIALSFLLFSACNTNNANFPEIIGNKISVEPLNDTIEALGLVKDFRMNLYPDITRSDISDFIIEKIEKSSFFFENKNSSTKSNVLEEVEVYNFIFKSNVGTGFAIVTPDDRIKRVLVYVENGSISDTAYIVGMTSMLDKIPFVIAEDLHFYYNGNKISTRADIDLQMGLGPRLKSQWGQGYPYNISAPQVSCNGTISPALCGCAAIATAQCIACIGRFGLTEFHANLDYLKNIIHASSSNEIDQRCLSDFIIQVGVGINTNFGCNSSSSNIENVANYLSRIGFVSGKDFEKRNSNNVDLNLLIKSLRNLKPVIARGVQKGGDGHEWVLDGIRWLGSIGGKDAYIIHCNWGWDGMCNGWYSDCNQPQDQITSQPVGKPFNSDNKYLYFY